MKYTIVTIGIILAIISIITASYMPLKRARAYIHAINNLSNIKTIDEFKSNFNKVFDSRSPIGDEEAFKFLSPNIVNFVSNKNQSEAVSRVLVDYVEPKAIKNDVIHLLSLANMYRLLWQNYQSEADYEKSKSYLEQALSIGPKLPPVLYSILDLYLAKGETLKAKEIAQKILELWPDDGKVQSIFASLGQLTPPK